MQTEEAFTVEQYKNTHTHTHTHTNTHTQTNTHTHTQLMLHTHVTANSISDVARFLTGFRLITDGFGCFF